jgi:hypothetical protein
MSLVTKEQAAKMLGVPTDMIDVMIELGSITAYRGVHGEILCDVDELIDKDYFDPNMVSQSKELTKKIIEDIRRKSED